VSIGADRLMGFRRAMEEARIPIHKNWIVEAGFDEKTGYDAAKKLLSLPKEILPEAIFAVNDSTAFGAMEAIYEEELKIPDDIAIVGFSDDKQDKLLNPPLTTVHQPAYEEGKRATQILIDMIEGKSKSIEDVVVKSYLVIRKSCGCK